MLNKIESDYDKLRKKEFRFILENGTIISLKFKKVNLPHLIGIGKLEKDDSTINKFVNKKISAKDILKELKKEGKTYDYLKEYESWSGHLTRRMNYFNYENINLLIRQSVVIDYVYDSSQTSNDKAKFIFYAEMSEIHLHLFIGEDENGKYYYPNSFTAENEKNRNSGSTNKIKVSKIIIQEGRTVVEEINHDKYKKVIRELRPQIKQINKLRVKMNEAERNSEDIEKIDAMKTELCKLETKIRSDFEVIDKYIPIDDFLKLKHNKKISKFYDKLL